MTETIIKTDSEALQTDAKMLQIKALFYDKGFKGFPRDLVAEYCPFKTPKKVGIWLNKMSNVWHMRSKDKSMVELFKVIIEKTNKE